MEEIKARISGLKSAQTTEGADILGLQADIDKLEKQLATLETKEPA